MIKLTIINGGKDNAIAFGLTAKMHLDDAACNETKEVTNNNFYVYKYHGRNGYIYSQSETLKHVTAQTISEESDKYKLTK